MTDDNEVHPGETKVASGPNTLQNTRPAKVDIVHDAAHPVDQATDVIDAERKGLNPNPTDNPEAFGLDNDEGDDFDTDDDDVEFDDEDDDNTEGNQNIGDT